MGDNTFFHSPCNVLLTPQGGVYGTVLDTCYLAWGGGYARGWTPTNLYNGFYSPSGTSVLSSTLQPQEFTDGSFTTSLGNLIENNTNLVPAGGTGLALAGSCGVTVLACSQAGYCGVGTFGIPHSGTGASAPVYWASDMLAASYICASGTTIFYDPAVGNNSTLGWLVPSGINAISTPFLPIAMNDSGKALGTGSDGAYFWSGTNLVSLGTNSVGTALNNQDMVIGYTTASGSTTGMLWLLDSGSSVSMHDVVQATPFKDQIQGVIPLAISNVDSSGIVSIVCSGSVEESSGTATILTPETLIFQVNGTTPLGTGTFSKPLVSIAEAPAGFNFGSMLQSVNKYGVIAAIGDPQSGGKNHAFILIPVQFWIENKKEPDVNTNSGNKNLFDAVEFDFSGVASIPQLPNISLRIGIVRDMKSIITNIFVRGAIQCNQSTFLPDTPYPNYDEPTQPDTTGKFWIATTEDQPQVDFPEGAYNLKEVDDVVLSHNFVVVQFGNANPVVVAQINWSYNDVLKATPAAQIGDGSVPFPSTNPRWTSEKPDPLFQHTKQALPPVDPVVSPGTRTGKEETIYTRDIKNYVPLTQ